MCDKLIRRIVPVALAMLAAMPALAQPPGNIDDRFRIQSQPTTQRERETALMTGDTDLILLRRTPLFTLTGSGNVSATSNAFLAPTDGQSDLVFQGQASLRMGTRIGEMVDIHAEAGLLAVRYDEFGSLGYNAFTGAVGVAARVRGFDLSLAYNPSIITSRDFGTRQLTQHQFSASIARPFQLGRLAVTPSIAGQRVESSPGDYRNWSAAADVTASYPFALGRVPAAAFGTLGYERRWYDAYFPDLLGVDRDDKLIRASAGFVLQPAPWANVRLAYQFARNRSSSDVNGYRAHTGLVALTAAIRF